MTEETATLAAYVLAVLNRDNVPILAREAEVRATAKTWLRDCAEPKKTEKKHAK